MLFMFAKVWPHSDVLFHTGDEEISSDAEMEPITEILELPVGFVMHSFWSFNIAMASMVIAHWEMICP